MSDQRPNLAVAIVTDGIDGIHLRDWLLSDAQECPYNYLGLVYDDASNPSFLDLLDDKSFGVIPLGKFAPDPDDRLVIAYENPSAKFAAIDLLRSLGAEFISAIHSSVTIGQRATLGEGIILAPDTVIGDYCTIGAFAQVGAGCTIKAGAVIGAFSSIDPNLSIGTRASVSSGYVLKANLPDRATTLVFEKRLAPTTKVSVAPPPAAAAKPRLAGRWGKYVDPFAEVWPEVLRWLETDPGLGAKRILVRLQGVHPGRFQKSQYQSLHRRLIAWRGAVSGRGVSGQIDG